MGLLVVGSCCRRWAIELLTGRFEERTKSREARHRGGTVSDREHLGNKNRLRIKLFQKLGEGPASGGAARRVVLRDELNDHLTLAEHGGAPLKPKIPNFIGSFTSRLHRLSLRRSVGESLPGGARRGMSAQQISSNADTLHAEILRCSFKCLLRLVSS